MIPAATPAHRSVGAKTLFVDRDGAVTHSARRHLLDLLRPGDLLIANDAATLPASLAGTHLPTLRPVEVRLAGSHSLNLGGRPRFSAIVFGEGDFRVRTEDRPLPPPLVPGDSLLLGPLQATVEEVLGHPRFVSLTFEGSLSDFWEGLAHHGKPVQYSHIQVPLNLWDSWTSIAGPPVAFEPPSAGFILDWNTLSALQSRGVRFKTITHSAGLSSTGDPALDSLLPLDEPYRIPVSTADAIHQAQSRPTRVVAVGTTVVRALEDSAARHGFVAPGSSVATLRLGPDTPLRIVDAIVTGTQRGRYQPPSTPAGFRERQCAGSH